MTNSSPPDPQNPIPERRRRAVAGVTFDEMIAIVVAFSTIGTILFWSLGGRNSKFASNFGLGKERNPLILGSGLAEQLADPNTSVTFGDGEFASEQVAMADGTSQPNQTNILAPGASRFETTGESPRESYQFDTARRIAPIAGVTAGSGLAGLTERTTQQPQTPDVSSGTASPGGGDPADSATDTVGEGAGDAPDTTTDTAAEGAGDIPDTATPDAPNIATEDAPDTPDTVAGDAPDTTTDRPSNSDEIAEMPDDVEPSYWAYPFVKQMSEQALVADFADDQNFEPDKLITRASMATLISQAFPMQPETQQIKKFKDVTNNNAIAADVDKAVRIGFMEGYSDDEFRPLENIPRYQVLVTLASGLGLKPSQAPEQILQKYRDGTNLPDWAKQQVAAAVEAGLAVNRPDFASDALNPNESATRAEVAAMIHQALVKTGKLEPIESEYLLQP